VDARELLILVKRFQELEKTMGDSSIVLFWREADGEIEYSDEVLVKFRAVNRLLRRFTATPSVMPDFMGDLDPASRGWHFSWGRTGGREQPFIEVGFALNIVEIASAGKISSLKQCASCRKWLFARFPHQRFCSDNCKEAFHRSNEADKKRRRDWARENYRVRKALDLGKSTSREGK
jgi:predicted nucleic acid-binding Zn ribbon protein